MNEQEQVIRNVYSYDNKKQQIFIDINLDRYTDLYNEWDFSPAKKRDLDEDLYQYLIECSQEIPLKWALTIRLHLPESLYDPTKEATAQKGIWNYFHYRLHRTSFTRQKALKQLIRYGLFGVIFLFTGVFLIPQIFPQGIVEQLSREGLIIGGWVLFWECFSIVFFEDKLHREHKRHLKRLIKSKLEFIYT